MKGIEDSSAQTSSTSIHRSVLLQEVIEGLNLMEGGKVLDGTINGGGHSSAICQKIGKSGVLIGMDLDQGALSRAKVRLKDCEAKIHLVEDNYRHMKKAAEMHEVSSLDAILIDLGLSSDQLDSLSG